MQIRITISAVIVAGVFLGACLTGFAVPAAPTLAHQPLITNGEFCNANRFEFPALLVIVPAQVPELQPPTLIAPVYFTPAVEPVSAHNWAIPHARAPPAPAGISA